jgi:hypothetical protein
MPTKFEDISVMVPCKDCGKERKVNRYLVDKYPICGKCAARKRGPRGPGLRGVDNPNWRGGRYQTKAGYIKVYITPDSFFYPMVEKNKNKPCFMLFEHRLVMAEHMGRCLASWEVVHHKNGIKNDNRLENLEISTSGSHVIEHSKGYRDGYAQGLKDSKDTQLGLLRQHILVLETENILLRSANEQTNRTSKI